MSTSTPPAWKWLDECEVPVGVYQHMTSETPSEPDVSGSTTGKLDGDLSFSSRNLPDPATLREQLDSPERAVSTTASGTCCAGQPHAPGCESAAQIAEPPDCQANLAALMAEGYREMAGDSRGCEPEPAVNNGLLDSMERTFNSCLDIAAAKNHDYAADVDPFRNFRECGRFGVGIDSGILVRMSDKWSRLCQLAKPGETAAVSDETLVDTVLDLINYAAILIAVYEDEA